MTDIIKTEKLTIGYNGKPLIKDINIAIKKGEIITIIGPNGAGKSTLLKNLARQLDPIEGSVYLEDFKVSEMSGSELSKKVAILFTDRIKGEMMNCYDVVATGRYPYTGYFGLLSAKDKEIVENTMKLVKVEELREKDFKKISDGQRQRIMLARALCQEPEIVLLDEPTSFLDIRHKLEFLSILEKMKEDKKLTVIMSVHELDIAQKISDRILCLKGDTVDKFGTPEEVFTEEYIRNLFDVAEDINKYAEKKNIKLF
ncbi:MAG: ABC transporter ATP-binding protein [Lachnospiraceae bacterium]|nr:ABC transporter ATP-binding protein [Lachnospiraceae bacterium]